MKHCWHATGYRQGTAMTRGMNRGSDGAQCCWCGKMTQRQWHEELRPVKGHGPNATEVVLVYEADTEECPERHGED